MGPGGRTRDQVEEPASAKVSVSRRSIWGRRTHSKLGSRRFYLQGESTSGKLLLATHSLRGLWLWSQPARMLENAFGARVMNELVAPHEPLPHEHLTPRAETLRQLNARDVPDEISR
jgi:hypothetical protein